jgi:hypothetical protein
MQQAPDICPSTLLVALWLWDRDQSCRNCPHNPAPLRLPHVQGQHGEGGMEASPGPVSVGPSQFSGTREGAVPGL